MNDKPNIMEEGNVFIFYRPKAPVPLIKRVKGGSKHLYPFKS